MFGQGISREGDILDLAAQLDIIVKSGAWYAYEGNKIGQGRENAKQYLRDNPEVCEEVCSKVRVHYGFDKASEGVNADSANTDSDINKKKASK